MNGRPLPACVPAARLALLPAALLAACGEPAAPTPARADVAVTADAPAPDAPAPDVTDATVPDVRDATAADVRDAAPMDAAADVRDAEADAPPADVRDAADATPDVPRDAGVDVATDAGPLPGGPCPPYTATPRGDPCPASATCGFTSRARVRVTGARSTLREFQVRVTLPAAVRSAAGAACDRMVFRAPSGAWAPHWVQDCAAGVVWVRVPSVDPAGVELALHYGGGGAVAAASSYDDVFDRVPLGAAGLLGAWTFDEGTGTRTCPAAGTVPFDAYVSEAPYARWRESVTAAPALWSEDAPASPLGGRFTRGNRSLEFPRSQVIDDPARPTETRAGRVVNWRTPDSRPLRAATAGLTVGVWAYVATPADEFGDNWQTVVAYGMPADPAPPFPGADVSMLGAFNTWALFFYGLGEETSLMANTCAYPCLARDDYAHIVTRAPLPRASLLHAWHFLAMTVDAAATPHAVRRVYYDGGVFEHPRELATWPQEEYCPGGVCRYPAEGPLHYYDAPVLLGADMNSGDTGLGLEGRVDDLFILARAASAAEIQAWRERRQYSPDPVSATVLVP